MNTIITGASSGIGRALVSSFARDGHAVLAIARRAERLKELSKDFAKKHNAVVYPLPVDITAPGAPQAIYQEAIDLFGKVQVLINNAGMSPYQEFAEMDLGILRQVIGLNVLALTELCHLFLPHMLDHGEPSHVVNVGSVGGYAPLPNFSIYSGTKHFVRVFTNMLRYENRNSNVKISSLHPGGTLTEFPELAGERLRHSAMKGMMTAEAVAEIAYPAILKGKRVIIPGGINKLAVLIGKVFPFPLSIRVMSFVYNRNIEKVDHKYPI